MKKVMSFAIIIVSMLLVSCATDKMANHSIFEDVPVSLQDLQISDLPENANPAAKLFCGKIWAGRWFGATVWGWSGWRSNAILVVEKYIDTENMTVLYSWGEARGRNPGKERYQAKIRDGKLEVYDLDGKIRWVFRKSYVHENALEGVQDNTDAKSPFPLFSEITLKPLKTVPASLKTE
jgi:hypothetical protein